MGHRTFERPDHLPKRRAAGLPSDPAGLPRQRAGTTPQMHGRYPDYDVLANARHWDDVTRQAILDRVEHPPPLRFFDEAEARCLRAFLDVVLAQDAEPRIPVLAMVDAKLHEGRLDGLEIDASSAWSVVMRGALAAFYSHPWAWNEIGFGGPAYPRGYMRLQVGHAGREPSEADEAFEVDPVPDVDARGEG